VDEDGVKMPRMETGGWERRKLQTRIALAEAAVRLFRDRGYEATTVEDIARAAHSSSSTFFRYFRTKEDVLFLNIREIQDHFRNFLGQPIPGLSCWEQIHLGINIGMLQVVRPSTEVEEFSIRSWLNEPAVRGRFLELVTEMENTMAAALVGYHLGRGGRRRAPNRPGSRPLGAVGRAHRDRDLHGGVPPTYLHRP
jgi:AcrR family transcriptional regulator